MVRRLGIELVASAEQARQVLRAFSRDLGVLEAQSSATEKALNRAALGRFPGSGFNQTGGGQNLTKSNQQLLALGNTFKVVTDLSLKLADGQEVLYSKTTGYTGDVQRFITAQQSYNQVLTAAQAETATYTHGIEALTRAHDQLIARQRQAATYAQAGITTAQSRITNANASIIAPTAARDVASQRLAQAQSLAGFARNAYAAGDITLERLNRVNAIVAERQAALTQAQTALTTATQAAARERGQATSQLVRSQASEARAQAAITTAEAQYAATVRRRSSALNARLRPGLNAAEQQVLNAINAPAALPPVFQQLSQPGNRGGSPQLLKQLQKSGLNLGNLGAQGAQESFSLEKDLVRNVTRVNGAFLDQNNVLNRVSAEFDKSGRVITRFGGQMSGLGNVLGQLSRNFQKVIEFAVATTVVFSALRYAIEELGTIVEIDKSLRQFSITANLTRQETKALFDGLSEVAITTATPLKEVVKAADDIALATRKSGQSTKEWQTDILSLTNSVGILTNLAGIDTVKATDLLVSSMKQLNLTADDLPSILSKITAVAGGQSAAIADIIQGLGVMAEAGKQGGLSVDQMIAAVQTLSQVTSKSPAEVATAFKNLVGSLASPGSIKQLEKYDIKLRDTQGNLRNILDIYGEISTKIKSGVIPQADVQALVRGISGGPRRAPDAAALLGSIDSIAETTTKSVNATNEALIANAKILDTAQAKFTQLQVRVDKFATTKFSDVLNETLGALVDILSKVLAVVEKIPAGFYVAILQFGLMALAVKSLAAVAKFLLAPFQSFYTQLKALSPAMAQTTAGMNNLARARAGVNGAAGVGASAGIKGNLGALKGPAALGGLTAALTLAGGGSPLDAISSGLESAGIAGIIALPGPLKLVGAAALAAGAGIQFFSEKVQDSTKATSDAGKDAEQILNIYNRIQEATETISTTKTNQSALEESMDKLKENTHKSAQDLANLSTQQKQYTDNILIMADATNQLAEAQKNLADIAPGFAQAIAAAQRGEITNEELQRQIEALQLALLKSTNPSIQDTRIQPPVNVPFAPYKGADVITAVQQQGPDSVGVVAATLEKIKKDYKEIQPLFKDTFLFDQNFAGVNNLTKSGEAIDAISEAINKAKAANEPWAASIETTWKELLRVSDATNSAALNLQDYQTRINVIKLIDPEQGAELQKVFNLVSKIVGEASKTGDSQTVFDSLSKLFALISSNKEIGKDDVQGLLETYGKQVGAINENVDALTALQEIAEKAGFSFDFLKDKGVSALGAISQAQVDLQSNLEDLDQKIVGGAAQKLAELQAQHQSGEFKGQEGVYKRQVDQLNEVIQSANEVTTAYTDLAGQIPDLDGEMQAFAASLTGINGLQDAQSLTTDQLIDRMFSLANTYGLTGQQVDTLADKMVGLIDTLKTISAIKVKFGIGANVDVRAAILTLKAMKAAAQTVYDQYGHPIVGTYIPPGVDQAIAQLEAAQNLQNSFASTVGSTFQSGKGGSFYKPPSGGSKAKKGPGLDVSTLDIPEEILNASNSSALIQEAIKRAKSLQGKIPGASKEAKNDVVELLKGTQRILEVRGVKDDLLRKALEELADIEKKKLEFETKADTIRRIRVGAGDFAAIANVPVNSQTGVSLGGASGPINVTLNINGTVLTPAQLSQFADLVAAALKRQIAN